MNLDSLEVPTESSEAAEGAILRTQEIPSVALLTGGQDKSYALGLAVALSSAGVRADVVGNDRVDSTEYHRDPNLRFFNLGGIRDADVGILSKLLRIFSFYIRLFRYITFASPGVVHILWNNKFEYFDRSFLTLYLKLLGKRVVLTAHNVNKAKRDSQDSLWNRCTLRIQYRLAHRIFVHTEKMKSELIEEFSVKASAVVVIPFGIYNVLPDTGLSPSAAKRQLGIGTQERTILFFGRIVPYKGLEYLLAALTQAYTRDPNYRLIIAGEPMKGYERYMREIQRTIDRSAYRDKVIQKLEFIPDAHTELYFKAADVFALPYKDIFQSGVLFVGFTFGLPALAADVGSFSDDVIDGKTGYLFKPGDSGDLARALEGYFDSDLYRELDRRRKEIRDYIAERHSWDKVAKITLDVYEELV